MVSDFIQPDLFTIYLFVLRKKIQHYFYPKNSNYSYIQQKDVKQILATRYHIQLKRFGV